MIKLGSETPTSEHMTHAGDVLDLNCNTKYALQIYDLTFLFWAICKPLLSSLAEIEHSHICFEKASPLE